MVADGKKTEGRRTWLVAGQGTTDLGTEVVEFIGLQGLSFRINLHEDRSKPHTRNYHRCASTLLVLGAPSADVGVTSARAGMLVLEHGLYRRVKVFDS